MMQAPGGFVRGRDAAIAALAANADNARSKVTWTPIGGGTSSGGTDGFTYGYMTTTRPDGTTQPGKYVAYWVRQALGWRIAVYRRVPRPAGDVALTPHALSVATRALPVGDSATVQRYADELSLTEHSFSREAQSLGLGAAFARFGAPAAVNVGNGAEFVRGPEAIGRSHEGGVGAQRSHRRAHRRPRRHHWHHPDRRHARRALLHDLAAQLADGPVAVYRGIAGD
jgi:hypothetical protein